MWQVVGTLRCRPVGGGGRAVAVHTLFASPDHAVRRGRTLVPAVLWGVWVADGSRGVFRYSRQ
jgi:hypothetical protein